MIVCGNDAWVQAGAGVVADSVPEQEHLECENKARALLAAVPAARRMSAQRRASTVSSSNEPSSNEPSSNEPSSKERLS
jgi:chorismate binding enzyme